MECVINLLYINQDPVMQWAVPVFLVFIVVEWLFSEKAGMSYHRKDARASILMGMGSAAINFLVKGAVFYIFHFLYVHRIYTFEKQWIWSWVILFLLEDFSFYLHHRSCHEVRLFWAGHVNHHSSQQYNLAVALRQSWGELFHKYIWWMWLAVIGFEPGMIFIQISISLVYQFFLHTEYVGKTGLFEWVFNTPSHHRVHHGSNEKYIDKNHGGILIIWDRIFGTFQVENEKVVYGITKNIDSFHPIEIAIHEYRSLWQEIRATKGWLNKCKKLFSTPQSQTEKIKSKK